MGRCTAKSKRSEMQCNNWAMRKKAVCRFHGGKSTGPKTGCGKKKIQLTHLKHGYRTKESIQNLSSLRKEIKKAYGFLKNFDYLLE